MLKIESLHFSYGRNLEPVLKDLSLELGAGEIGILLGRNGAGKTTLFQNILGIEKPQKGRILFDGQDLGTLSHTERARLVAYVPQHIHFGALTVYDSVLMGRISNFGFRAGKEDREAVWEILEEMHLQDFAARNAENLSGGEKQKVAIARALAQAPRLMVFDEPTGNLDMENEELIIEEARKLAREKSIAILSSLHDLNQAMYFGNKFFFMKDGTIKYAGDENTFSSEVIKDIFNINARIIELDGKKIVLGGRRYEA